MDYRWRCRQTKSDTLLSRVIIWTISLEKGQEGTLLSNVTFTPPKAIMDPYRTLPIWSIRSEWLGTNIDKNVWTHSYILNMAYSCFGREQQDNCGLLVFRQVK